MGWGCLAESDEAAPVDADEHPPQRRDPRHGPREIWRKFDEIAALASHDFDNCNWFYV
jgi:hypothetical protein